KFLLGSIDQPRESNQQLRSDYSTITDGRREVRGKVATSSTSGGVYPRRVYRRDKPVGSAASFKTPLARLHSLNQNLRRLGPHDAGVGQDAGAELLAQLPPADRDLFIAFRPILIDQANAAQLFIKGREADLHRLNEQLPLQLVELALGG